MPTNKQQLQQVYEVVGDDNEFSKSSRQSHCCTEFNIIHVYIYLMLGMYGILSAVQ